MLSGAFEHRLYERIFSLDVFTAGFCELFGEVALERGVVFRDVWITSEEIPKKNHLVPVRVTDFQNVKVMGAVPLSIHFAQEVASDA